MCGDEESESPMGAVDAAHTAIDRARGLLSTVRTAIDELRAVQCWRVFDRDLLDLTREVESVSRSLAGVSVRLTGELVERGMCASLDVRAPADLLHDSLNITMREARQRVRLARASLPIETPTGETIPAEVPEALQLLDAGEVTQDHAVLIVDTIGHIPAGVDDTTKAMCRDTLIDQSKVGDVTRLGSVARQIRNIVDPDGKGTGKDPVDRQELTVGEVRQDGLAPIKGYLDQMTVEALRQAIEPLAAPTPIDDKTPDPRPPALRRAQALGQVLSRYLKIGKGPIDGGFRPQIVVTISLDDLLNGAGSGWADYTGPVSAATARLLACDADLIPQVLDGTSVVLDQGRAQRLFPPEIRRAIVTRDRGCCFPGCSQPAAWCDAHHIAWWTRDLGPTSERNGALLCRFHHALIHQGNWLMRMAGNGRPEFIPPPWIDPNQRPRTNHHWEAARIRVPARR